MTVFEKTSKSELQAKFKIMLQLTSFNSSCRFRKNCSAEQKNVLKNKVKLFEDKQIFFSLLGDKQNFKFGGI